jgi:hypothetical protein
VENFFESIRAASAPDATTEARTEGVAACRAILAALGEPVASAPLAPPAPPPIASMVAALRGVPPDQLLDLAIQRLRAALPPGVEVPPAQPLKFHLVPAPKLGGVR